VVLYTATRGKKSKQRREKRKDRKKIKEKNGEK
jgi:hypothetical protein